MRMMVLIALAEACILAFVVYAFDLEIAAYVAAQVLRYPRRC